MRKRDFNCGPSHLRGVYRVPCSADGCNLDYYGRTSRPFGVRMNEHKDDIRNRVMSNSMVKHIASNPGHGFNFDSAKILWKTRSVIEQRMVESSCIATLPNCNTSIGEIHVNPIIAALVLKLSNIPRSIAGAPTRRPSLLTDLFPPPALATPALHRPPDPPSFPPQTPPASTSSTTYSSPSPSPTHSSQSTIGSSPLDSPSSSRPSPHATASQPPSTSLQTVQSPQRIPSSVPTNIQNDDVSSPIIHRLRSYRRQHYPY